MLFLVKNSGHKYAYDTASGAFIPLGSLEYKMLTALEPPLEKNCPTSLRYELAKYDSDDVSESYAKIYSLYLSKTVFADSEEIKINLEGDYAPDSLELAMIGLEEAFGAAKVGFTFVINGNSDIKDDVERLASDARQRLSK